MRFFVGLHQTQLARNFERCFISVNILRKRRSDFEVKEWILDSGAFTEISKHGCYKTDVDEYAEQIDRWSKVGNLLAAVSQDFMCEPFILSVTKKTVKEHQEMTIDRYDRLLDVCGICTPGVYIMPVLQGYRPLEYVEHIRMYGTRLAKGAWVGVGSVCKRNSSPFLVEDVLSAVKRERSDLRIHGFGLKLTALKNFMVYRSLETCDSMAWSFAARMRGGDANDWREAKKFCDRVEVITSGPYQTGFEANFGEGL